MNSEKLSEFNDKDIKKIIKIQKKLKKISIKTRPKRLCN